MNCLVLREGVASENSNEWELCELQVCMFETDSENE